MKHIKKKFLLESNTGKLSLGKTRIKPIDLSKNSPGKSLIKKDNITVVETETGYIYFGSVHKLDGKPINLPIPDPTLVYFNNAQLSIKLIEENRKKLLEKIDFSKPLNEPALNEIYNYFGTTSGFVIFLFTSIESFINQLIPDDLTYEIELTKKTEVYNKKQAMEHLDFRTKITKVLQQAPGKNFFNEPTSANQRIWNLKQFRDDIIHTKPDESFLKYQELIKTSLNFKYEKTLESVATFMNFYKPDYIIECSCGADF